MGVEAKTAIIEHLGRQHQAMVALFADLVNIDGNGSFRRHLQNSQCQGLRTRDQSVVPAKAGTQGRRARTK